VNSRTEGVAHCEQVVTVGEAEVRVRYVFGTMDAEELSERQGAQLIVNDVTLLSSNAGKAFVNSKVYLFGTAVVFSTNQGVSRSVNLFIYDYEGNELHNVITLDEVHTGMVIHDGLLWTVEGSNINIEGNRMRDGRFLIIAAVPNGLDLCDGEGRELLDGDELIGGTYRMTYMGSKQITPPQLVEDTGKPISGIFSTLNCSE
jgi:hypothetical protein